MANNMSADNLKNNLTNLQRGYMWAVTFVNPIGGGNAEALSVRCQSTSIPGSSFPQIVIPYKGGPGVVFAGKLTMPHTWTLTFVEANDGKIFDAIYAWKQSIIHDRLNVGLPDALVKADMYLDLLDQAGVTTKRFKMVGGWPQLMDDTPLTYDRDAGLIYTCTFSYDRWEKVQ